MLAKANKMPFRVGGVDVFPFDAVRDLGVVLDSKMTMKNHVDNVVAYVAVSTLDAAHTLVHAFVGTIVDSTAATPSSLVSAMVSPGSCSLFGMLLPVW